MSDGLAGEVLGNPLERWLAALAVAVLAAAVLAVGLRVARARLVAWSRRTDGGLDDGLAAAVAATRPWFVAVAGASAGLLAVALPARLEALAGRILAVALILQAGLWLHAGIGGWLDGYARRNAGLDGATVTTTTVLGFIGRLALWSLVVLMLLANAGVDITALVTSLGIGGVAVALAAQNILGDIFASLAIALDRPVAIGDFIVIGDTMGVVERVGMKTTHLRSLSGELVVLANTDLLASRIRNYKRMFERRVLFGFGVTYETGHPQLAAIPATVRGIVEREDLARFDRAHLSALGASAIEFEVVYFVRDPDYNQYMDVQQRIILGIVAALREAGVEFAYPTQTIHLAGGGEPAT